MKNQKYFIAVASKDHIIRGVNGGFIQANHGKAASLKKLKAGDWLIVYSPKKTYAGNESLQAFTAIGQIKDEELYQGIMAEGFVPWRRNVTYYRCNETLIAPLINDLDFIENKKSWGFKFRFGFFEIGEEDFEQIRFEMLTKEASIVNQ